MSRYGWTRSNPLKYVDPTGQSVAALLAKLAGVPLPFTIGGGVSFLAQIGPFEFGIGREIFFFPDTCEIAAFMVSAGFGTALRDWRPPNWGDLGPWWTWGLSFGVQSGIEGGINTTGFPASAAGYAGPFNTLYMSGTFAGVAAGGSLFQSPTPIPGTIPQWIGGSIGGGWSSPIPPFQIGLVEWDYKLIPGSIITLSPLQCCALIAALL
jgi:hypothetical protein